MIRYLMPVLWKLTRFPKQQMAFGIMGGVKEIPRGFIARTILAGSDQGIRKSVTKWGEAQTGIENQKL